MIYYTTPHYLNIIILKRGAHIQYGCFDRYGYIQGLYTKYADVVEQLSGSKERM